MEQVSAAQGKPPTRQSDAELESAAWLQISLEALKSEDYELAVHSLSNCINLKQSNAARAWLELGKIVAQASLNPSKAYDFWFHQHSESPEEALASAIQLFENAIALKPDYAEGWLELSKCHDLRKEYAQAISAAKEATRLAPNECEGWMRLSGGLFETGSYDEAIDALQHAEKVATDAPQRAGALVGLGIMYDRKGDREKVLKVYQELQGLDSVAAKNFFQEYVLPQQHTVQPGNPSK